MPKEIKKSYDYLGLKYNASKEDVEKRYNLLVKKLTNKEEKTKKSYTNKKEKLLASYKTVNNFIEENGTNFEAVNVTGSEVMMQLFVLVMLVILFVRLINMLT